MNSDSSLIATSSARGTIIWVWNTSDGSKFKEVRWGKIAASIYSLAFNIESTLLAVCSSKGTCHIYYVGAEEKVENTTSWFSKLGKVVNYFNSEWSFA